MRDGNQSGARLKSVLIAQPYVAAYRVPFYRILDEILKAEGISLTIAEGTPNRDLSSRSDHVRISNAVNLKERRLAFGKRSLVLRSLGQLGIQSDLIILEQARKNIEAYRHLLTPARTQPIALWGHGYTHDRPVSRTEKVLLDHLTRRADWFFAYTDSGARYVETLGFPSRRCTVVNNSTDTGNLRRAIEDLTHSELHEFRSQHGLALGRTALFVGGLDASKRVNFLLDAVGKVQMRMPDFRLLVVGAGQDLDLVEAAARRGLPVVPLGPLRERPLAVAAGVSEAILMPGRVGLVAVDSFALGKPIITTNWPFHAPEFAYLSHDNNAIISADSPSAFSNAIAGFFDDSERRHRLQEACRQDGNRFSIESMAARFAEGVIGALDKGRRSRAE